ncbi:MAG: type II secretion system F family protein [Elusimicrobia bacterium]|nr:type II secretion system F family protein [Elusimicrobiota bacterium]
MVPPVGLWLTLGAGLLGSFLTGRWLLGIPCLLVVAWVHWAFRQWAVHQRWERFHRQLAEGLTLLAQLLRAGSSLPQAVEHWAQEAQLPLQRELHQVIHEIHLGVPLPEAVDRWASRAQSPTVEFFAMAVAMAWEGGGSTAGVFSGIAEVIRERQRVAGRLAALTAQGRLSGYIMAALPIFLLGMLELLAPELTRSLWQTTLGNLFIIGVTVLVVAGLFLIERLVNNG